MNATQSSTSTSWSWRHRFYAFLLRRAIGPLLTPKSASELRNSIQEIDWSTGEFCLVDVELDPVYLTSAIQGKKKKKDDNNDTDENGGGKNDKKATVNNIAVYQANIRKIAIHLSVSDNVDPSNNESSSSTARKATSAFLQSMFGNTDTANENSGESSSSMAIKVHVELHGLDIVLAPGQNSSDTKMEWTQSPSYNQQQHYQSTITPKSPGKEQQTTAETAPPAGGFFSSLIDSAMKSLRLSIDVSDVNIRAYSQYNSNNGNEGLNVSAIIGRSMDGSLAADNSNCLTLHIDSIRYYDLIETKDGKDSVSNRKEDRRDNNTNPTSEKKTREKVVISKALDWDGIIIDTGVIGPGSKSTPLPIFQSHGGSKLRFRVFEKRSKSNGFNNAVVNEKPSSVLSARQSIDISLGERISIEVDLHSLTTVLQVANALTTPPEEDGDFVDAYEEEENDDTYRTWEDTSDIANDQDGSSQQQQNILSDEFSRETYDQIMKQYTEARHLARTRELRGGLLIPSFDENGGGQNDVNDGGEISFDAFFDANDHSLSYYCSIMDDSSSQQDGGSNTPEEGRQHRSMEQTKLELGLAELTVKVNMSLCTPAGNENEKHQEAEYILLSVGDLRVLAFSSNGETKLNCSLSHFDIESQVVDDTKTIINEPVLRFIDESDDGLLLSSPPSFSLMAELLEIDGQEDKKSAIRVDIALQPIEITHQERALRRLSDVIANLPRSETPASEEIDQNMPARDVHLSIACSSVLLLLPCQQNSMQKDAKRNSLFQRHGYKDQGSGGSKFVGVGLELENTTIDLSRKTDQKGSSEESKAALACSHVVFFAKGIELEQRGRRNRKFASFTSRRADLVALSGDEDSETSVSISFSKFNKSLTMKRKSIFPIILPLSSTRAKEDDESDDEIDNLRDDAVDSPPIGIQSSDPQYILSSEANEAEAELVIIVPNIYLDFTTCERQELSKLISGLSSDDNGSAHSQKGGERDEANDNRSFIGIGVDVGQFSVILHGSQPNTLNSYNIIMDKIQLHALIGHSGLRNVRFLSHDVTLYELSNLAPPSKVHVRKEYPTLCHERCKLVQERHTKCSSTLARTILFRQKLCKPLSHETPAFQIDILLRGDDSFCGEIGVHVNIYDMTYRYIMNSEWVQNLSALVKGDTNVNRSDNSDGIEERASLINLFVNLADCNMDYTPPTTFKTPSRVILRLSEIRFSSNIVTPSATIQAYKLTLCDLTLHICNYRHSYNEENCLLSCAHRLLNNDDLFVPEKAKCLSGRNIFGMDDALCRMGFVNIVSLDVLDATIFKSNAIRSERRQNDPAATVALTLGKLAVNACNDSFSCLNQTYNEWFIKSTALSEEELEKLRELSDSTSEVDMEVEGSSSMTENECSSSSLHAIKSEETMPKATSISEVDHDRVSNHISSTSTANQQHRDDTASIDLTRSLLFQNYYTFDAKTKRKAATQLQGCLEQPVLKVDEDDSASSEDEWAAVEHDFLQHANIPREADQTAEWIICDSEASAKPDGEDQFSTQTLKVYPQHIPLKPVLDPFAAGDVDTAKLAGTSVAPDIGLRVIVKDGLLVIRFFDGYDWINDAPQFHQQKKTPKDRKEALLSSLVGGDESDNTAFDVAPLQRDLTRHKLRRNDKKYFQISLGGLKLKNDSFSESQDHKLASRLDLAVNDFMIVETISTGEPVKMMGEWINESEHPRDDNDGMIMLHMITKHPQLRVSADGKLMSDESRATLELLPLRCYFNQNALRFVRNFFASGSPNEPSEEEEDAQDEGGEENDYTLSDDDIINIFFESFKVRACKLKVDYEPENMDIDSFRDGNYIELLNICPLEEMVLSLQMVKMNDLTGWGPVFGELAGRWIEDICATQSHKFFTRASPFQPFSNLGDPLADLAMVLVVPEGSMTDYFKSVIGGTANLATRLALETISTSAKITRFAAKQLNGKALPSSGVKSTLPRRPRRVPKHAGDTLSHAYDSVTSGLREANYKIVTVPLREYQTSGGGAAARSALRGVPIGISKYSLLFL